MSSAVLITQGDPESLPTYVLPPASSMTGQQHTPRNLLQTGPWLSVRGAVSGDVELGPGDSATFYSDGTFWYLLGRPQARVFTFKVDGGGSSIVAGALDQTRITTAGFLQRYSLIADAAGSCVVDVCRTRWPTIPTTSDSICRGFLPTLSSQRTRLERLDVLKWDFALSPNDVLLCVVKSASGIGRLELELEVGLA